MGQHPPAPRADRRRPCRDRRESHDACTANTSTRQPRALLEDLVGPVAPFGALVASPAAAHCCACHTRDADVMNAVERWSQRPAAALEGPRSVSAHGYGGATANALGADMFDEADDRVEFHPPPDLSQVLAFVANGGVIVDTSDLEFSRDPHQMLRDARAKPSRLRCVRHTDALAL